MGGWMREEGLLRKGVLRKWASGWCIGVILIAISRVAGWGRAVALVRGFYWPNVWPGRGLGRLCKNKMAGTAGRVGRRLTDGGWIGEGIRAGVRFCLACVELRWAA